MGELLAKENIGVVYGGASVGLMGTVADACLANGGEVIGVIPQKLADRELAHTGLTEQYFVSTMHERKGKMADMSDGFISLPGGSGTMDELFETWTWEQLGFHQKPCGILNIAGYYDPLVEMVDHMVKEGFLQEKYQDTLLVESNPGRLLEKFRQYEPPTAKWHD